jgi:hypothetical protein
MPEDTSAQRAGLAQGELRREVWWENGAIRWKVVPMEQLGARRLRIKSPRRSLDMRPVAPTGAGPTTDQPRQPHTPPMITVAQYRALQKGKR